MEYINELIDEEVFSFIVKEEDIGNRLDVFISSRVDDLSRSYIQKLIKDEKVLVNSKKEKPSYKVCVDDEVILTHTKEDEFEVVAQNIDLDIIYEDDFLVVVDKPKGMVVHPAPGNKRDTLVNALKYKYEDKLSNINGDIRPGIVHRIDKDTSGLLVIAKDNKTHIDLASQFEVHSITREYEMVCVGSVDWQDKTVETNIGRNPKNRLKMAVVENGGKRACTHFHLINQCDGFIYMKATLETGRTHQIRVHSSYIHHPILGDTIYGYRIKKYSKLQGQTLHARKLGFIHPASGEYMEFISDLPLYFEKLLKDLSLDI